MTEVCTTSFGQVRLWFLDQPEPTAKCHLALAFLITSH
jgi:hypothetical protein